MPAAKPGFPSGAAGSIRSTKKIKERTHLIMQKRKLMYNAECPGRGVYRRARFCLGLQRGRGCAERRRAGYWGLLDQIHTEPTHL